MSVALVPNQPLFSAFQLASGQHTLSVNVTSVQVASPFTVDYFLIMPDGTSGTLGGSSGAGGTVYVADRASNRTVGVLAGVFSAIILVQLCIIAFLFVVLRRHRQRQRDTRSLESSLFTRSESILGWSRVQSLASVNSARYPHSAEKPIRVG